jgi:cyclohexanone monooxygenase
MRADPTGGYMFMSGKAAADISVEERTAILDSWWKEGGMGYATAFTDVLFNQESNDFVADYLRGKMAERIDDPVLREKLIPRDYAVGTRRPVCDAGYLEIFNQPNVSLVDLRETPVVRFTETGIETSAGHQEYDIIILAIGFDALTGGFTAINPVSGSGESLTDHWNDGPSTFMGITVAGFPNLFMINGPGAAAAANIPLAVEATVDWIADMIDWMGREGVSAMSPRQEAEDSWTDEVLAIGNASLFMKTPSWFTAGNIAGRKRGILVYLGGLNAFVARAKEVAAKVYQEFIRG